MREGPILLEMRMKQLMKENLLGKAALLAKTCSQCRAFQGKGPFKQMYLVCLCATSEQDQLMDEVSAVARTYICLKRRAPRVSLFRVSTHFYHLDSTTMQCCFKITF